MQRVRSITRALKHRNYRLFFAGQTISLIGTWLTRVATSWLVYRLTKSAFTLGVVGFAGQFPTFLFAPIAGVLVDRWNRYRVLVWTQVLAMVQSALLAIVTLTGIVNVTQLVALAIFQGIINAFDVPARQSFVVDMIEDRKDLPNAIALNSSMVNMARLIGPSVAGVLIALIGEGGCFTVDAISYVAVIGSLLMMKVAMPKTAPKQHAKIGRELMDGLKYAMNFSPIRSVLLLLALVSLMGMPYTVLLPVIVAEVLNGGPYVLGYLTAASGFGALIGVLYLASRESVLGLGRIIPFAAAVFGVGLVLFSLSHSVAISMVMMFATGMGMMVEMAASNTILQTVTDDDKRGRVMSLFTMAVFGMAPFGSLLSGILAEKIGAPKTIFYGGLLCILGALFFLRALPEIRQQLRPVYRKLGILPELPPSPMD